MTRNTPMNALRDSAIEPNDAVLAKALATAHPAYGAFIAALGAPPLELGADWRYYRDVRAWLCRIVAGKRTVSWLSVWPGYFKVTTYFGPKQAEAAHRLAVDAPLLAAFEASGKGRKNRYFMIDVADAAQLPDLYRILRFKRECR